MEERIICAANKYTHDKHDDNPIVILGIRHGCSFMFDHFDDLLESGVNLDDWEEEQGFVTSKHRFVSRKEAWFIAESQGQIIRDHNKCIGTLYSEHLY